MELILSNKFLIIASTVPSPQYPFALSEGWHIVIQAPYAEFILLLEQLDFTGTLVKELHTKLDWAYAQQYVQGVFDPSSFKYRHLTAMYWLIQKNNTRLRQGNPQVIYNKPIVKK